MIDSVMPIAFRGETVGLGVAAGWASEAADEAIGVGRGEDAGFSSFLAESCKRVLTTGKSARVTTWRHFAEDMTDPRSDWFPSPS